MGTRERLAANVVTLEGTVLLTWGRESVRARWPGHYPNAIVSDDEGRTRRTREPFPERGTGEATIADLLDGRLSCNSRVHGDRPPRQPPPSRRLE